MSSYWKHRKVLVTGAGGFIGSHLAEQLAGLGAHVRAFVHYNALGTHGWLDSSPARLRNRMEVFAGELLEYHSVRDAMRGCETVFHLGALIAIPFSYRSPHSYLRTNVEGTLNVLQAARELKTSRVMLTSTSEVYGSAQRVPIDETHPLCGQSPYAASKISADAFGTSFHRSFDVDVVIARPFNTFGPRQSARAVIPTILSQLLTGAKTLRLGALSPTRDMNPVWNTCDAFLAIAEAEGVAGQVINFGSGREVSIGELAELLIRHTGSKARIICEQERLRPPGSEVERLVCDNTLAGKILGWKPRMDLDEGLDRTIAWFRKNLGRYRPDRYAI